MTERGAVTRAAIALCVWTIVTASAGKSAAQTIGFEVVGVIPGRANLVELRGGRAYVAAEQTLTIYDVSDPGAPARLGSYDFQEKLWDVQVEGALVYAAADFFGLGILDVSNPAAPTLLGSLKTPGQAKGVALAGQRAVMADHMSGMNLVDISDPSAPVLIGSFYTDGYARDVATIGTMAYAVDAPTGVYLFDLSTVQPLEPVGSDQSATAPSSVEALAGDGPQALLCMVGRGYLQVYDVSDAAAPVKVAALETPSGRPLRATVSGRRAYVADGPAGLQVVDLSTPSEPRIVGAHPTTGRARDVAVDDGLVLLATSDGPERRGGARSDGEEEHGEVLILREISYSSPW